MIAVDIPWVHECGLDYMMLCESNATTKVVGFTDVELRKLDADVLVWINDSLFRRHYADVRSQCRP